MTHIRILTPEEINKLIFAPENFGDVKVELDTNLSSSEEIVTLESESDLYMDQEEE